MLIDYLISFRNGEQEGFNYFFTIYYKSVYFFAVNYVKDSAAAEDIVENSFIKLWEKKNSINLGESGRSSRTPCFASVQCSPPAGAAYAEQASTDDGRTVVTAAVVGAAAAGLLRSLAHGCSCLGGEHARTTPAGVMSPR